MVTEEKVSILAAAAKYDVSCSSSGTDRPNAKGGIGSAQAAGICHSWSADGRCISLLKILFTNFCIYDCAYCVNRRSNDIDRAAFTVSEIVELTLNFYRRNYIEGLFLSSGIIKSPDYTMELLIKVVKRLRLEENYHGYIHLKAIPGASRDLLNEAGLYVDRFSVNIELPSERGLNLLAPQKTKLAILNSMSQISSQIISYHDERSKFKRTPTFVPAGQSTQLIVGATPESDLQIVRLSENLYQKFKLKRVYYSAFVPVNRDPLLPVIATPPLKRENRLYQADWLLRFYGFRAEEILDPNDPFLESDLDPKTSWALRNLQLFPLEVNKAAFNMLLRVPGIGVKSAQRIIQARRFGALSFENLSKLGVTLKRARYFLTCQGKPLEKIDNAMVIRAKLLGSSKPTANGLANQQLSLFEVV